MTATTASLDVQVPERFNVSSAFVDRIVAEGGGARTAIIAGERRLTYAELKELCDRTAGALSEAGVEIEQRVAILLSDGPEFVASFWGAIKIGAVPIPLNTLLRPADYQFLLDDSRARLLITEPGLWESIAPFRGELSHLREVLLVGGVAGGCQTFEDAVGFATPRREAEELSRDDSAFWLYTSGSTGFPKGAIHLQHDIMHCTRLYARNVLGIRPDDVVLGVRLFHAYPLGNGVYFPEAVGAASVMCPGRPTPEAMFDLIQQHRVTIFFGVPTLYAAMLALPDAEKRFDTSSLRLCVSAGESLPADLYHRWRERFGTEILDGIGTTEILHIFISNQPGAVRPGSSGRVVPGYVARLIDEAGNDVPQGEIGSLMVSGDSICAGYWNRHEVTKRAIRGEWMLTGDNYYQDADGYFWYCGRNDDMLKVGGVWVSPAEVEATLIGHSAVLEAAVVGKEDHDGLVKPKAYVVLHAGQERAAGLGLELQNYVKQHIAPFKYPRWIEFVDELPKTATGKIQRFKLREYAAANEDHA